MNKVSLRETVCLFVSFLEYFVKSFTRSIRTNIRLLLIRSEMMAAGALHIERIV